MKDEETPLADLEDEFSALAATVDTASARRRVLVTLIEKRKTDAATRVKIGAMTGLEKESLQRVLSEDASVNVSSTLL